MKTDIIIVGGGGAGMCAALEADARGLTCVLLEADIKLGGSTALSSGVYYAAGTSIQRANGITTDTPDAMYDYVMTLNQWALRPEIIRLLCERAAEGLDFLIEQGVSFPNDHLVGGGRNRVARGHSCSGEGGSIATVLADRVRETNVVLRLGTRVDGLIVEHGRVVGVRAGGEEYRGGAVVMTTGGFGNNKDMLARLYPSVAQHGDKTWAVHEPAPYILGDGIAMAEQIGAGITGHDTGLPLPTAGFKHNVEGVLPPWIMLVNVEGRRFMAETSPFSASGYLINAQTGSKSFAIFDEKTLREVSDDLDYLDPLKQRMSVPSWHQESIREEVARGVVKQAMSIEALGEAAGINPVALVEQVRRYNADHVLGRDMQFNKNSGHHAISVPPFYAVEVRASMIGLTAAGLDIDDRARVLDAHGRAIPGLYAGGEILGCVIGTRYSAGGVSIANAVVFGRRAGECAAEEVLESTSGVPVGMRASAG
ncbi:FAD-dependent oxidoreductase [Rhizorhabdus argentea]|uniref:FAD-dependent oxidoreductase n=1 Tax=Rhizorhabdus argentea TaxID=1387174 RepID=UPI0030EC2ED0